MLKRTALFFLLLLPPALHAATRPDLVVVISIDQFRYDYLERFAPWFSEGGFNRFLKSGANFPNAYHSHANTFTGPGHAAIGSGRNPSENGIVANTWFERTATNEKAWQKFFEDVGGTPSNAPKLPPPYWYQTTTGAPRYCVDEMSPVALSEDSLGDRLKEKYPQSRVIAVSLKDRAAILMGGRKADAAYWFDGSGFVCSGYYHCDATLLTFDAQRYVPSSGQWTLSGTIPDDALRKITFDPPEAWRFKNARYETHFPHAVPNLKAMTYTPFGNDMLLDFATRVVDVAALGARGAPDLLFVGLSTPDSIGHYYGPDSTEVAEDAVLLDRSLEKFINALDGKFHDRLLIALTADHGVQPSPEIAKLRNPKIDSGRVDFRNPGREGHFISDLPPKRIEIERQLAKKLDIPFLRDAPMARAVVAFFEEPSFYLNWLRIAALKLDGERVKRALRDVVLRMDGIEAAFTNSDLIAVNANPSELERAVRASFRADRSGDVIVQLKKNWIWNYGNTATHGQALPDDQHVPLMFWGTAIVPGRYDERVAPTDIARTISEVLDFRAGGEDSRVLFCVDQRRSVLALALAEVESGKPLIIVVPENLVDVVAPLRKTVLAADGLPEGYARLDQLTVTGNTANVRLWLGPIPAPQPGVLMLSCGTGHMFTLQRENGVWRIVNRGVAVC